VRKRPIGDEGADEETSLEEEKKRQKEEN